MNIKTSELKSGAKAVLLGCYGQPMLATSMYILLPTAILSVFRTVGAAGSIMYYAALAVTLIIQSILSAGLCVLSLQLARNHVASFSMLFFPFKYTDKFFFLALICTMFTYVPLLPAFILFSVNYEAIMAAGTMDGGTAILFFVLFALGAVASIYLTISMSMAYFIMADKPDEGVLNCVKKSFELMKGNCLRMLYLQLSFLGWELLGMLSLGLGYLWVLPYYYQTMAGFYRKLLGEHEVIISVSLEDLKNGRIPGIDPNMFGQNGMPGADPRMFGQNGMPGADPRMSGQNGMSEAEYVGFEEVVTDATPLTDEINKEKAASEADKGSANGDTIKRVEEDFFFDE